MHGTEGTATHLYGAPLTMRPPPESSLSPLLRGSDEALESRGPFALLEALLKRPANVMHEVRTRPSMMWKLGLLVSVSMALTGVLVGSSAGGLQLLAVPLKASLGMLLCAAICWPSLYIFAALAGSEQSAKETLGALLLGVAVTGVLLVAFAPVSWVFTQATQSPVFLGALHLLFLLVSATFGLRITRRALSRTGQPMPAMFLWTMMFLLVVLQMTTTLRPLVGPWTGLALAPREFFIVHWAS